MSRRPRFKPQFRVRVLPPDAVYLLSETRSFVLNGQLYARLAPLLDGEYTIAEIAALLGAETDTPAIEYAIARLVGRGFVTFEPVESDATWAFWGMLGVEAPLAEQRMAAATVTVIAIGDVPADQLTAALQDLGIPTSDGRLERIGQSSLVVVVTDDYLRPDLAEVNRRMLGMEQPWVLLKPVGTLVWIGPLLLPGRTACWQCLAQRLEGNRPIETFLRRRLEKPDDVLYTATGSLPTTQTVCIQLAATEIAKWLALGHSDGSREWPNRNSADTSEADLPLLGRLVTYDTVTLQTRRHTVVQRPQCSACGEQLDHERDPQPISLEPRKKLFTSDGGHRSCTPEETIRRFEYHLSPITGIVNDVHAMPYDSRNVVRCYQSVVPFGLAPDYRKTADVLHRRCHGKGKTERQAWASAFCEAIERYSALFASETDIRIRRRYEDLGDSAVHPRELMLFSDRQYEDRERWNAEHPAERYWTPPRFDDAAAIDWTPAWSLTSGRFRYLPAAVCYFAYPIADGARFCIPDSNGVAAGNNIEEAVLQGLFEVIERDAVGLWWYNEAVRPAIDLDSVDDPFLADLRSVYADMGRDFWVLDITTDLGVPSFVALSARSHESPELVAFGCGTHFDPHIALLRAVTEMNQCAITADGVAWGSDPIQTDRVRIEWMRQTRIGDHPHLTAAPDRPQKFLADFGYDPVDDLLTDIDSCVAMLARHGLETLVLDLTKPDVGLNVVRVTVPGLRPNMRRLAPGRLYDVPVRLGWLRGPREESQMNPVPMFM